MIYIGTCSWTEKTLIKSGDFYPRQIRTARERLGFYSAHFKTVEVDSSYYAIPSPGTVQQWVERTPDDFIFHVKAYGALTGHGINPMTLPEDILEILPHGERDKKYVSIKQSDILKEIAKRFVKAISPLREAGKLGVLVFQFPPWFHYHSSNLDYIEHCRELMSGMPVAVEFRHGSWLTPAHADSVFHFLCANNLTYITADEPQYGSLATIPFLPEVTTEIAYFRFHGRNRDNWLKKGVETSLRYAYLYSDKELRSFIPSIREADRRAKVTYAMFNNCHGGFAIKGAMRLNELIEETESD
jgi:uncharacterized protein YecE (DUF72 family)